MDPRQLEFELTESTIIGAGDIIPNLLKALKGLGVRLTIDDFGTGYSNLGYLTRFPIDTLKIDQSFVRHITANADDAALTEAIIGLAKSLGRGVIAEGVETAAQATLLHARGCEEMQGYYFNQPLPAAQIENLLPIYRHINSAEED